MADQSEFVWLEWPDTGYRHRFGTQASEAWQGKGWVPCDPPPDVEDPRLRDPEPPEPEPEPEKPAKPKSKAAAKSAPTADSEDSEEKVTRG
jgi:hypothetical protein